MAGSGRKATAGFALDLIGAVLVAIAAARLVAVAGLLPYSQHVDETFFTASVLKMIRSGDANPRFFRYPSLPLYLSTRAMLAWAPFLADESLTDLEPAAVGVVYSAPSLYAAPRVLLAVMSVGALALLAVVAWCLFGPAAGVLTPILLSLSGIYQVSAVYCLNVDVVTVFFVAATLAWLFSRWDDPGLVAKAIVPGVLSGMVVASTYNSGLILVPRARSFFFASVGVSPRAMRARGAKTLAPDLVELDTLRASAEDPPAWVVLPEYAERAPPPAGAEGASPAGSRFALHRARAIERRIGRLEGELGGRVVLVVPGRALELSTRPGVRAAAVPRPAVRIVRVGG